MRLRLLSIVLVIVLLSGLLCNCGKADTNEPTQTISSADLLDPNEIIFESIYKTTGFSAGKLNTDSNAITADSNYAFIVNYPVKKGRVLSISDQKFHFSVIKYEDGSYCNTLKDFTIKNYTVMEDMNIAISIRKSDSTPITDEELSNVMLRDTLFRMTEVNGNIHRFDVEAETIDGGTQATRAALFMPVTYTESGTPNKLILITNGHKGYLSDSSWYSNTQENTKLIKAYLEEGYGVFVVDNTTGFEGKTSDMGCPQLISSYFKAYEYIREHFNVEDKIYLHSRSFGTFAAIRLMRERPELFKCAIMTGPRVSMQKEWDENRPDKDHVAIRFGFDDITGQTYEAEKLVGHDPYTDIQNGDYSLPPTFWIMAKGDMTERPEEFIEQLHKLGNDVTSATYAGLDHTGICALDSKQSMADAFEYLNKH